MSNYDRTCSLPAYREPKDHSRQKVLSAIEKLQPCTNKQIAEYLNKPINEVTGRTRELVESNLVESAMKAPDPESGRLVNYWQTVKGQMKLFT